MIISVSNRLFKDMPIINAVILSYLKEYQETLSDDDFKIYEGKKYFEMRGRVLGKVVNLKENTINHHLKKLKKLNKIDVKRFGFMYIHIVED